MKKTGVALVLFLLCVFALTACSNGETRGKSAYEVALDNGFEGTEQEWLDELKGKDGENGLDGKDGTNGVSGKDGRDGAVSVRELYELSGFEGTIEEFIESKMSCKLGVDEDVSAVAKNLLATVTVTSDGETLGSGLIYKLDKEAGNAYVLTEYAVTSEAASLQLYLYGSDTEEQSIEATCVCGSEYYDVALLCVQNSDVLKESDARAITFADSNDVCAGQTAISVGNLKDGITVTSGVVGVDSENLKVLNTVTMEEMYYRVLCSDCTVDVYSGGGGLFDKNGDLIGMTSALLTSLSDCGRGYALPSNVVRYVAENLLYYYENSGKTVPQKCILGITIGENNTKAVFDTASGKTKVVSDVTVTDVDEENDVPASGKLYAGDVLKNVTVVRKGETTGKTWEISRSFVIIDLMLTLREGDRLICTAERTTEGEKKTVETVFEITDDWIKEWK